MLKSYWRVGWGGGPQDYRVSPSPLLGLLMLELGWNGLGSGPGTRA